MLPRESSVPCEGIHSNSCTGKSMACIIDVLNVKEERVAVHKVFSKHVCFCSIIQLQGKNSDASRKQTSQEMICEKQADRDKDGGGRK